MKLLSALKSVLPWEQSASSDGEEIRIKNEDLEVTSDTDNRPGEQSSS